MSPSPTPATILPVLSLQIKANQVPLKPVIKMGPSWPLRPLYLAQTYLSFLPATSLPSELFGLSELFHDFVLMGTLWPLPGIYLYFIISMITKTITTTTATSTLLHHHFHHHPHPPPLPFKINVTTTTTIIAPPPPLPTSNHHFTTIPLNLQKVFLP